MKKKEEKNCWYKSSSWFTGNRSHRSGLVTPLDITPWCWFVYTLIANAADLIPPPSQPITVSQPDTSFNLASNVCLCNDPKSVTVAVVSPARAHECWLPYDQAAFLLPPLSAKAATDLGKERLLLIRLAGGRAEVEGLRLEGREGSWVSQVVRV